MKKISKNLKNMQSDMTWKMSFQSLKLRKTGYMQGLQHAVLIVTGSLLYLEEMASTTPEV